MNDPGDVMGIGDFGQGVFTEHVSLDVVEAVRDRGEKCFYPGLERRSIQHHHMAVAVSLEPGSRQMAHNEPAAAGNQKCHRPTYL